MLDRLLRALEPFLVILVLVLLSSRLSKYEAWTATQGLLVTAILLGALLLVVSLPFVLYQYSRYWWKH